MKTAKDALKIATPEACKKLLASGINFAVAVETGDGDWLVLHAESLDHANTLAHEWVENHDARGASIWRLFEHGPADKHCGLVTPCPTWDD